MRDVVRFVLARVAEEEAQLDCGVNDHDGATHSNSPTPVTCPCDFREKREVRAKRIMVDLYRSTDGEEIAADAWTVAKWALLLTALPYADHPDYNEKWRM